MKRLTEMYDIVVVSPRQIIQTVTCCNCGSVGILQTLWNLSQSELFRHFTLCLYCRVNYCRHFASRVTMRSVVFVAFELLKLNVHPIVFGSQHNTRLFSRNSLNIVEVDVSTKYNKVYCKNCLFSDWYM